MKLEIRNWVTLLTVWVGFTVSVLEGVRPVPNPLEVVTGVDTNTTGTRWAVLVAGSQSYENYRHQADVCHAYQILKNGGLKDENIIVFMYDDIAHNPENPRPGVIINKPNGPNVYKGVPKDYTGAAANAKNFYAVLSGNRSALSGGSGKVLNSGPNDIIFIYYADHGAPGIVSMPVGEDVVAHDLVNALKKKHAAKSYKKMVIYMEACEAGSMFEGLLPNNINIYVTTASNAEESSFATYCPGYNPSPPPEYTTCLGDAYSVAWLEDSEKNNMRIETLEVQYQIVQRRTLFGNVNTSSHVMQYGDITLSKDYVATYIGALRSLTEKPTSSGNAYSFEPSTFETTHITQKDAHLLHLWLELEKAPDGSKEKLKAQKKLSDEIAHRDHVDNVVYFIGDLLFGEENSSTTMFHVGPTGQPLVDDWDCFKILMKTYERYCGTLSSYGRTTYSRSFANMCNAGISEEQMAAASSQACSMENHSS